MSQINLEGHVAILTGGSRGIGAATVQLLAAAGARVIFSYARRREAAAAVVAACPRGQVFSLRADVARPESAERLVRAAVARWGRLDIAINNAGYWNPESRPLEQLDAARWDAMLAINLRGAYALARAAARQMRRQRPRAGNSKSFPFAVRGRILLVSSTAGQRGEAFHSHYGAAKAGVIGLVRGLAPELAPEILINCLAPGWVATEMAAPALRHARQRRAVLQKIPLGRIGAPEEIAGGLLFLCSPWANFMTGSVLSMNGGAVLA